MSRSYPDRPIVGVGAVVWRDGQVLLARRGQPPKQGTWTLPGGMQHVGETVAETARREIREETGLDIEVIDMIAVVDLIERDAEGKVLYHYTIVDLLAEWREGEAVAGDDVDAVAWVSPDSLQDFELSGDAMRIILLAAERRRSTAAAPLPE